MFCTFRLKDPDYIDSVGRPEEHNKVTVIEEKESKTRNNQETRIQIYVIIQMKLCIETKFS